MFTQQCIIHKNTKEIINFLNEIGYTLYEGSDNFSKNVACSCKFNTYFTFDDDEYVFPNIIDCKKNKELFFAVAALRDDSDKHQLFVLETTVNQWSENCKPVGYFVKCVRDKWFFDFDKSGNPSVLSERNISAHKATVEELIEHFNK